MTSVEPLIAYVFTTRIMSTFYFSILQTPLVNQVLDLLCQICSSSPSCLNSSMCTWPYCHSRSSTPSSPHQNRSSRFVNSSVKGGSRFWSTLLYKYSPRSRTPQTLDPGDALAAQLLMLYYILLCEDVRLSTCRTNRWLTELPIATTQTFSPSCPSSSSRLSSE